MRRRRFVELATATGAASLLPGAPAQGRTPEGTAQADAARSQHAQSPWPLCLDTATVRPASLEEKVRIAAAAGFDAVEPWEGELHQYEQEGGSLADLGQKIKDAGLFVPSVIGLWNAIPQTRQAFDASLVDSRRRMRQAAEIGAEHIQVVPQPARPREQFDPAWAAARYRELLEIGLDEYQINPAMVFVEFLEGSKTLGMAAQIALDADHPKAKIIPDTFHMLIGGSGFAGLAHLQPGFIAIFQINDAPMGMAVDDMEDSDRVFPGDGILPLEQCLRDLRAIGYEGCVSLELYNPAYWDRGDLEGVAREGIEKTLAVIEASSSAQ